MSLRCILFDVDGTLINTWKLYMEIYWRTLRHFKGEHITREDVLSMKPSSEIHFIKENIGEDNVDEAHEVMIRYYDQYHDSLFGGVYPGVREVLDQLRAKGYLLGIVTGKSSRAWNITSLKVELGRFDVIVADDDVQAPKPDPQGIEKALHTLNVSPEHTIYIGDTLADFKAARAAGVRCMIALWAKDGEEKESFIVRTRGHGATEFLHHPHELLEALQM